MGNALSGALKRAVTLPVTTKWVGTVTMFARAVNQREFNNHVDEIEQIVRRTITSSQRTDSWNAVQKFAKCLKGFKPSDNRVLNYCINQFLAKNLVQPQGPQSTYPEVQQLRSSVAGIMSWSNANISAVYSKFDAEIYQPLDAITNGLNVGKFSSKQHLYKIWRIAQFARLCCHGLY